MRVCTSCRKLLPADAQRCPEDGAAVDIVTTLPASAQIGGYRIERMLGEGGMGFVYEATHVVLKRRTAIKMLRPELAAHAQVVTRFLNEAKAVNLIDHQNIVNVYDYGDNPDGSVYFVMEFLEGETLDELMRRRQVLPLPLLIHAFGQIVRALAAAHAKQIVHRDLKPANVYVVAREDNPCFIKLLDFGIAQLRGHHGVPGLTLAGTVLGTPQYMSPEQITGGTVDARSDVWAVGVMMYRAATGHAPFKGEEFAELADKILHHPPRPASEIAAVPPELSQLIARCLERRIDDRCPSAAALLAGLEQVKRACRLDDDAIGAAVRADAVTIHQAEPGARRELTRDELAGSRPEYQGARQHGGRASGAARGKPKLVRYAALAAALGGAALGVAAYVIAASPRQPAAPALRQGAAEPPAAAGSPESPRAAGAGAAPQSGAEPPGAAGSPDSPRAAGAGAAPRGGAIAARWRAGDRAGARAIADEDLRAAIAATSLSRQGQAVDALARAHTTSAAPLLYAALDRGPEVRGKAARAIGELALPDAVPRLRAALAASGDKLKVEIAAVLYRLGDKDVRAILVRALGDPAQGPSVASALADAGDAAGKAVLADLVATTPPGREAWRRAAAGLAQLGDPAARKLLAAERAQPDAARSIGAAELLARLGDTSARDQLARVAADPDHARPGDAALALARLGDKRALGWVAGGLVSSDPGDRSLALAICGALAADAAAHTAAIAAIASDDPDPGVRMTAEAVLLDLLKDIR